MDDLLRPKQSMMVLRAENDPKPQKVEVRRVELDQHYNNDTESLRQEVRRMREQQIRGQQAMTDEQRAIYDAQAARLGQQQSPLGLGAFCGIGAQQRAYGPGDGLMAALRGW